MPNLLVLVTHAFGLARKGSSLGIFPFPWQTGHLDNIAIAVTPRYYLFFDIGNINKSARKAYIVVL